MKSFFHNARFLTGLRTAAFATLFAALTACTGEELAPPPSQAPPMSPSEPLLISAGSQRDLVNFLRQQNYSWTTLEHGVPPFILDTLPEDLVHIAEPTERKHLFFLSLLPMVLLVNEQITQEREEVSTLFRKLDQKEPLTAAELARVAQITANYKIEGDPLTSYWARARLLERIDIIPPSVVLAQAATESGYGTSRFAQLANNLFGEMTFEPGTGLAPETKQYPPYEARLFASVQDSLKSYMTNLNTNTAYRELWRKRAKMRAQGTTLRGTELAGALTAYSERGEAYVRDLRVIINSNRLSLLSEIKLRPAPPQPEPRPIAAIGDLIVAAEK